jgi:single-strand DNA-binding protein
MPDTTTTIVGNLTENPELRFTQGGAPVANFTVAVTARIKDGDTWKDGETSYYRCTAWRSLAENAAESLTKGTRVVVYGHLRQRSWETPEGDKRSVVEVQVEELGPSLKWATAQVERINRQPQPEGYWESRKRADVAAGGGQTNDEPPF